MKWYHPSFGASIRQFDSVHLDQYKEIMLEIIGWLGSASLAICGVPLAWQTFKQKHARGINNWLIALWLFGEIATVIYIIPKQDYPLLFNYSLNIMCLAVVVRYKIYPKDIPA
jgi:hypothetical protein